MTTWRNQYVHVNEYTRPGKKLNGVRKLIVHYTANPGATAANHFGYFDKTAPASKRYASAHIFVDKTEAICIIPLDEVAYAAGDVQQRDKNGNPYRGVPALLPSANNLSISVELCIEKDGTFHADTIERAANVFAELCKTYKLDPLTDIVRHYDVTHKNCPAPWVADSSKFVEFKRKVSAKMGGAPTVVPAPTSGILRQGDSGADVKQLQTKLTDAGYPCGAIDGDFGPATKAALTKFQAASGLTADGIYGPATAAKLDEATKKKETPAPVPAPKPASTPEYIIGTLKVLEHTVLRKEASAASEIIRTIDSGEYIVHEYKDGWYQIGGWINAKYVQFVPYNETKITKE